MSWLDLFGDLFGTEPSPSNPLGLSGSLSPEVTVDRFPDALAFTLREEGGRVDDVNDRGGRTNHGITQRVYEQFFRAAGDVFDISDDQVETIYRQAYWNAAGCVGMTWPLALVHFDSAVLFGVSRSKTFLGLSANSAINYINLRRDFHNKVVRAIPSQSVYLAGWLARCDRLEAQCSQP